MSMTKRRRVKKTKRTKRRSNNKSKRKGFTGSKYQYKSKKLTKNIKSGLNNIGKSVTRTTQSTVNKFFNFM
jgi:hypothetical protein